MGLIAFEVGVDAGGRDADREGDLQGLEAFAGEEDDAESAAGSARRL